MDKLSALSQNRAEGSQSDITSFLKKEVVPFLSTYIKNTNNMGKVRDFIAMLTLNIAKYENGSMDKLEQSFNRLMDFRAVSYTHLEFIPGDIEMNITQYPDVVIEYIGGPIYVPPSADPENQNIDVKA